MSQAHTVRVTTTTTSSSTSALVLNTGYLKTLPGLLKVAEFILGCIYTGIVAYNFDNYYMSRTAELFFYLMAVTFLVCTGILLISCLISWSTGGIISKTIFELIYHAAAAILILISSIILLIHVNDRYYRYAYKPFLTASIIGIINAILYAVSAFLAQRSYKGIWGSHFIAPTTPPPLINEQYH